MNPQEMRDVLVERTISVIANEGIDKATTKAIVSGTGINEAYIYRCFSDKEDMMVKAFEILDQELVDRINQYISVMYLKDMEFEIRCRVLFTAFWKFLLSHREKCMAYVRFHYSTYFLKYSLESHKARCKIIVDKFRPAFKDEADVLMILSHILNVILDFAVKVHSNQMPEEDDYEEHVFRVIYASIKQYFIRSEGNASE